MGTQQTRVFAKLLTPHDDIARLPVSGWLRDLQDVLDPGPAPPSLVAFSTALNNLALIAIHVRQAELSERFCHLQINILCARYLAGDADNAPELIVQPIINLMRLGFRLKGLEENGPIIRFGDRSWLPTNSWLHNQEIWSKLWEAVHEEKVLSVLDFSLAREIANLTIAGRTTASPAALFMKLRIPGRPPQPASVSIIREAEFILGDRSEGVTQNMHPAVACPYLVELEGARVIDLAANYIEYIIAQSKCTRSNLEIAAATLEALYCNADFKSPELATDLIRYALNIQDEWLYVKIIRRFINPEFAFQPSIYLPETNNTDLIVGTYKQLEKMAECIEGNMLANIGKA